MAYGLQVWDSSGNIILDTTDRVIRPIIALEGTVPANSFVSIPVPDMEPPSASTGYCGNNVSNTTGAPFILFLSGEIRISNSLNVSVFYNLRGHRI